MPLNVEGFATDVTARRRLQPYPWADLIDIAPQDYIIKNVIDRGSMSVVYGESGCGKTFFTLDMALHTALARPWFDCRVRPAQVLYVAAEGGFGIARRLKAFRLHHSLEATGVPFFVLPIAPDLCDPSADTSELLAEIKRIAPVDLIILDTLSRVMAGGNENAPDDMGALVRNCDRIRAETDAHILLVHHTGKDTARGARGHSSLRAATDTEIEVSRDSQSKVIAATVTKQRDGESGQTFAFNLTSIEVGEDQDGDLITSCVIEPTDAIPQRGGKKLSTRQHRGLDVLYEVLIDAGKPSPGGPHYPANTQVVGSDTWREYLFAAGVLDKEAANPRSDFKRLKDALTDKGAIREWDKLLWAVKDSE